LGEALVALKRAGWLQRVLEIAPICLGSACTTATDTRFHQSLLFFTARNVYEHCILMSEPTKEIFPQNDCKIKSVEIKQRRKFSRNQ